MSTQDQILEALRDHGRQSAAQIAERLGDARGNVWASLDRLRAKGLVTKNLTRHGAYWAISQPQYFGPSRYPAWLEMRAAA